MAVKKSTHVFPPLKPRHKRRQRNGKLCRIPWNPALFPKAASRDRTVLLAMGEARAHAATIALATPSVGNCSERARAAHPQQSQRAESSGSCSARSIEECRRLAGKANRRCFLFGLLLRPAMFLGGFSQDMAAVRAFLFPPRKAAYNPDIAPA